MSNLKIRQALETKLASVMPAIATAWENNTFKPIDDVPYQEAYLLFAQPENPTFGDGFYRQRGIFQITLRYPTKTGSELAGLRAELLRASFKRGLSLTAGGVTTHVDLTPEVGNGSIIDDRYVVIIKIRFYADLMNGILPDPTEDLFWRREEW